MKEDLIYFIGFIIFCYNVNRFVKNFKYSHIHLQISVPKNSKER